MIAGGSFCLHRNDSLAASHPCLIEMVSCKDIDSAVSELVESMAMPLEAVEFAPVLFSLRDAH